MSESFQLEELLARLRLLDVRPLFDVDVIVDSRHRDAYVIRVESLRTEGGRVRGRADAMLFLTSTYLVAS